MVVYKVTHRTTGLCYVGKTRGTVESRWRAHVRDARRGSRTRFHAAIREHDADAFDVEQVEQCADAGELDRAERRWIELLGTTDPARGFNSTTGGQNGALCETSRRKISVALSGKSKDERHRAQLSHAQSQKTGPLNSFFGRTHSEETKRRIADSMRGERGPCFNRTGERHPMWGTQHSDEARQKMAAAHVGRSLTHEHARSISEGHGRRNAALHEKRARALELLDAGLTRRQVREELGVTLGFIYGATSRRNTARRASGLQASGDEHAGVVGPEAPVEQGLGRHPDDPAGLGRPDGPPAVVPVGLEGRGDEAVVLL